jgi:small subunit ribosomal protein S17
MTQTVEQAGGRTAPSTRVGVVTRKSSDQTIRVDINTLAKHAQYGKYLRRRTRLAVHDPANAARQGDVVEIVPCRRLSRTKSWRLVRVIRSGGPAMEPVAEPAAALRPDAGTDKG